MAFIGLLDKMENPVGQVDLVFHNAGVTYLGDNAKARRELGFAPWAVSEGLRELFANR